ncbi:MAG: DUF3144 domain-containing protein [Hyphomicrobiaceae bacterium]
MSQSDTRKSRRMDRREGALDTAAFIKVANKFIDLANRENQTVKATDLHLAFLWAAARYNAHVGKTVLGVESHEAYVQDLAAQYSEMLRQHLADPSLDG